MTSSLAPAVLATLYCFLLSSIFRLVISIFLYSAIHSEMLGERLSIPLIQDVFAYSDLFLCLLVLIPLPALLVGKYKQRAAQ